MRQEKCFSLIIKVYKTIWQSNFIRNSANITMRGGGIYKLTSRVQMILDDDEAASISAIDYDLGP